ncbi:MAG: signal peptidase I [Aestuariivirga sp.]
MLILDLLNVVVVLAGLRTYNIPSHSNAPGILAGDRLLVSTFSYGPGITPQLGDMAVFKLPKNDKITYVKRVLGLPGDRVQMRNGVVFINGKEVKMERVEDYVDPDPLGVGGGHPIMQYEETLPNGVRYRVLDEQPNGAADNTIEYVIPPGHYFMMGDNRDNSEDSRFLDSVGYVPIENFIGKVVSKN